MIRFLPFGAAMPGWGEALAIVGFVSAFYGVAVGLTHQNPKTILAYSSISQMGVIGAVLGLKLAAGQGATNAEIALYAANHVLVKGGLFLAIAAVAASQAERRRWVLVLAGLMALGLAGLPPTGGYLAKLAVKDAFGDGWPYWLATASSVGTALLMTHFLVRLAEAPREKGASSVWAARLWPAIAVVAIVAPWLLVPAAGLGGGLLDVGKLWDALWPTALGVVLGLAFSRSKVPLPRIPAGDTIILAEAGFAGLLRVGPALDEVDRLLRGWPAGSLSLAAAALILAAATFFG